MTPITLILVAVTLAILLVILISLVRTGRADNFGLPLRETLLALDPVNVVNICCGVVFPGSGLLTDAAADKCGGHTAQYNNGLECDITKK